MFETLVILLPIFLPVKFLAVSAVYGIALLEAVLNEPVVETDA